MIFLFIKTAIRRFNVVQLEHSDLLLNYSFHFFITWSLCPNLFQELTCDFSSLGNICHFHAKTVLQFVINGERIPNRSFKFCNA